MKTKLLLIFIITPILVFAQNKDDRKNPNSKEARTLVISGTEAMTELHDIKTANEAFAKAEADFRTAAALDPQSVSAKYNAGANYYKNKKYIESGDRSLKATAVAQTKEEKHKAFHNLGNALFQQKNFEGAVEAYKNALRNNPNDEETRYNLALAKKEKENQGGGGSDNDDKDDKNKDKDKNEENKDKNEENKDKGDQKESDKGDKKEKDDKGKDEEKDGKEKEDDKGKPDDKKGDKDKEDKGNQGKEKDQKKPPPQKGKQQRLSPQQVRSLLEAMKNEEQKTQDKVNARKVKGQKVKTEKDW